MSRWKPSPIEGAAKIAAEQELAFHDTISQMFRRTTPMGKKRLSEREQVARWLIATPDQREKARTTWAPGKFEEWNTAMFKALRRMRG